MSLKARTSALFKESMASIGNQTIILTTSHQRGITLSSFTSLSVNPSPLIQFNVQIPSRTSHLLNYYNHFAIHFLKPNEESVRLIKNFSSAKQFDDLQPQKDFTNFDINHETLPILSNVDKVLICKKYSNFIVQDHEIWIGEVLEILNNNKDNVKTGGLFNFNRKFYKIGDEL